MIYPKDYTEQSTPTTPGSVSENTTRMRKPKENRPVEEGENVRFEVAAVLQIESNGDTQEVRDAIEAFEMAFKFHSNKYPNTKHVWNVCNVLITSSDNG